MKPCPYDHADVQFCTDCYCEPGDPPCTTTVEELYDDLEWWSMMQLSFYVDQCIECQWYHWACSAGERQIIDCLERMLEAL